MKIRKVTIQGFRAFNALQEMVIDADLCLIYGQNSHGKTSLAEGLEFLFCGKTSRRDLLARSKQEFCRALRNVHSPADHEVFVEAVIEATDDGAKRLITIKRILDSDYPAGDANCTHRLLREDAGQWVDFHFSEIGLPDFDSPESTPIIFQHTLRYVSNAEPSKRREYFRRLLDVDDLYGIRDAVRAVHDRFGEEPATQEAKDVLTEAESLKEEPEFNRIGTVLGGALPDKSDLIEAFIDLMRHLLTQSAVTIPDHATDDEVATLFRCSIADRRARRFDSRMLSLPQLGGAWISDTQWDARFGPILEIIERAHEKYHKDNAIIDQQVEELRGFLQSGVELPIFRNAFTEPQQCPFCLTQRAVTNERIKELRDLLAKPTLIQQVRSDLGSGFADIEQLVMGIGTAARDLMAKGLEDFKRDSVAEYVPEDQQCLFSSWCDALLTLRKSRRQLLRVLRCFVRTLRAYQGAAKAGNAVDTQRLEAFLDLSRSKASDFYRAIRVYSDATPHIQDTINKTIDGLDKRAQWAQLATIYDKRESLWNALVEKEARRNLKRDLKDAHESISEAAGKVLSEDKFPALTGLVSKWWDVLRPSEPVNFKEIKPKGTGQRNIDIIATISGGAGQEHIERDAVAIFSDSQLNCLGLATFLARREDEHIGIIICDDPIQSFDDEHRHYFEERLIRDLLVNHKQQLLIFTHEEKFWDNIMIRYRDLAPCAHRVEVMSLNEGAKIHLSSGRFLDLLKIANSILNHDDPAISGQAGNQYRKVVERFCKEVMARHGNFLPSDYELYKGVLEKLLPKALPYLSSAHQSVLSSVAHKLNPPSHDDLNYTPDVKEMNWIHGEIKMLSKEYLKK
jgi:hypothetical protein